MAVQVLAPLMAVTAGGSELPALFFTVGCAIPELCESITFRYLTSGHHITVDGMLSPCKCAGLAGVASATPAPQAPGWSWPGS